MGIFDYFKNKKKANQQDDLNSIQNDYTRSPGSSDPKKSINELYAERLNKTGLSQSENIAQAGSQEQFDLIYQYRDYVVLFVSMMFRGNYSPIAAYQNAENNLIGYLYVAEDTSFNYTVPETLEMMEAEFQNRMSAGTLLSYALFYHSEYNNDGNHAVLHSGSRYTAISMKYCSADFTCSFGFPYSIKDDSVTYRGFSFFSNEQNKDILSAQLDESKNYFQERIEIKPEISKNEAGLMIKKVNNGTLGNMWSGIFGFERMQRGNRNILAEYGALAMTKASESPINDLIISDLKYQEVIFRFLQKKDKSNLTFFPVITNPESISVTNQLIAEWVNVGGLEGVISGGGQDTFGITYFATDYAKNKAVYHSNPRLNISLSGIIFQVAEASAEEVDFTMYMPHKDLGEFGVYDFIGLLDDFWHTDLLENPPISGYMLKVRLINDVSGDGPFSTVMFVNEDNSEIEKFHVGMKLSGSFQLQGAIKTKSDFS